MADQDIYVLNDPFDGGTHLPDLVTSAPVVIDGNVAALATVITHHQEMGGMAPGSTPMDATDIFQEGLRIPPMKLADKGILNETLLAIIERNVRIPRTVIGDLHAQLAACEVGRRAVRELVRQHGLQTFQEYVQALLAQAETLTRIAIDAIPDGVYKFHDFLDAPRDTATPLRIQTAVTVRDSELLIDMTGTAQQVESPINCVPASSLSALYYVVRAVTDPSIPNNSGCYRPVTAILPPGSLVNALPPAPVNARSVVVRRVVDTLLGAFAQALPARIPAASNGHPLILSMGGVDPLSERAYVTAEIGTGGMGARPSLDGIDAVQTDTSNAQNIPVEVLEGEFPLRVTHYRLRPDSGGPGFYRGGLGLEKGIEVLRGTLQVSHRGERNQSAPGGLAGGHAAATARSVLRRIDGTEVELPSKSDFTLSPGERLTVLTTGGGGYGDPLDRPVHAVLADVIDGKISLESAERDYGVIIHEGVVHVDATERLRKAVHEARGSVTWLYDRGLLGREQAPPHERPGPDTPHRQ
jgi:N-methylhydantoinase B/oxoprolinase/acetone carboxylase alpha subunit